MVKSTYYCDICRKEEKVTELRVMSIDEKLYDLCPTCYRRFKSFMAHEQEREAEK